MWRGACCRGDCAQGSVKMEEFTNGGKDGEVMVWVVARLETRLLLPLPLFLSRCLPLLPWLFAVRQHHTNLPLLH